jgi:hypothetical protein
MANASAILAVQEAIVTRLEADSTLQGLASFIGGYEPEIPPENFIVIGNATEMAWHTLGGTNQGLGWETTITVHCISYYKGDLPALQMLYRVTELLSFYELTVSGYSTAICEYGDRMTKVLIETKGKVDRRHVHALFTIRVHD